MKAVLFPGQGAQRAGMGGRLFDRYSELTKTANQVLGYSIQTLCLDGPMDRLTQTQFTQPALYVVNALRYLERREEGYRPDYLLGHSVSEYVALFAADVFDFETGLRLVAKRGELMSRAKSGGMAAVLGLDVDQVKDVVERHRLRDVFPANLNTPRQIVISGDKGEIERAEVLFREAGATHYKVLPVGGAFHSPYMADAQREFEETVRGIRFGAPSIPVISNVTARPHETERIGEMLVRQIAAPVLWSDSIRYLLAKGVGVSDFEEIGPEGVPVVKAMVVRTQAEAGPLDASQLAEEERKAVSLPAAARYECRQTREFRPEALGSRAFCEEFGLRYAYLSGGMYQGIASVDIVVAMAKAGLLGFFGTGGVPMAAVESAILSIQKQVPAGAAYGINFIAHAHFPEVEEQVTDLLLKHRVPTIEASAFMEITPAIVRYRAKGLYRDSAGKVQARNRIIAKISRPEVAEQFLSPAPERVLGRLLAAGSIQPDEAAMLRETPMADALCVESDSGGHTDRGMPFALLPAIQKLRDEWTQRYPERRRIHVGAAGGIGTPQAAAAIFVMGADFILTGSINQCTVEAGTSELVKELLQEMNVHDTDYAPSGDLFELGATIQVLKKGILFPARANKLVSLHRQFDSLEGIDQKTRQQIQERYFKRSFADVYAEVCAAYPAAEIERAERNPKHRMALVFKRYFKDTTRWALAGDADHKVDFQIHCGPALGAFNQWAARQGMQSWRGRHVARIAEGLMTETAEVLGSRLTMMLGAG
ncbi:MAG TPA: ACP S-malonyltransferase [Bryobacteraceae bacterium]|nr:ACP S-malonyltransferase [Bryobacteraceae bacterium]